MGAKRDPALPRQGIHVTALREIKILRELSGHPNIVQMLDAWTMKKNVLVVGGLKQLASPINIWWSMSSRKPPTRLP